MICIDSATSEGGESLEASHAATLSRHLERDIGIYTCVLAMLGLVWPLFGIALRTHSRTSKDGRIVISRSFTNPPHDLQNYHRHAYAPTTIARSRINIRLRPKPRMLSHPSPHFTPLVFPSFLSFIGERQSALITQSPFLTLSLPSLLLLGENPSARFLLCSPPREQDTFATMELIAVAGFPRARNDDQIAPESAVWEQAPRICINAKRSLEDSGFFLKNSLYKSTEKLFKHFNLL